jgi:hypothetical protein
VASQSAHLRTRRIPVPTSSRFCAPATETRRARPLARRRGFPNPVRKLRRTVRAAVAHIAPFPSTSRGRGAFCPNCRGDGLIPAVHELVRRLSIRPARATGTSPTISAASKREANSRIRRNATIGSWCERSRPFCSRPPGSPFVALVLPHTQSRRRSGPPSASRSSALPS